jgi:transposase InsO family protein
VDPTFVKDVAITFSVEDAPREVELVRAQQEPGALPAAVLSALHRDGDVWVTDSGQLFVPDVWHLRLRMAVVAHAGPAGHRGMETTVSSLLDHFWWPTLRADIKAFVSGCLCCLRIRGGAIVPRPLKETVRAQAVGEVLHFDFMHLGAPLESSTHAYEYVLVLQDGFSRYVELVPCEHADASTTVQALLRYFASHGLVKLFVSDRGSHFMAEVMDELCTLLRAKHQFITAYSPWANGMIERVNKTLLAALRAILLDARLEADQWPWVLSVTQSVLNTSPHSALGGLCPMLVFTGRAPERPLTAVLRPDGRRGFATVDPSVEAVRLAVSRLQGDLESLAHRVAVVRPRNWAPRVGEREVDWSVGDFVLMSTKVMVERRGKLPPAWVGPCGRGGVAVGVSRQGPGVG